MRFLIRAAGSFLAEAQLQREPVDVSGESLLKGQIAITTAGAPFVVVEDELVPLVFGLCLDAPTELARADHATVAYANDYGYLRLDREGPFLRVSGDGVDDPGRFPDLPLRRALIDCGQRFAQWSADASIPGEPAELLAAELARRVERARLSLDGSPR